MKIKEPLWKRLKREFPDWVFSCGDVVTIRPDQGIAVKMPLPIPSGAASRFVMFNAGPFANDDELIDFLNMRRDTILIEDDFNRNHR